MRIKISKLTESQLNGFTPAVNRSVIANVPTALLFGVLENVFRHIKSSERERYTPQV